MLIIDNWTDHGVTENRGAANLVAGVPAPVKLEYYNNARQSVIKLLWSGPSVSKQLVPTSSLRVQ